MTTLRTLDRTRLQNLMAREQDRFVREHPRSPRPARGGRALAPLRRADELDDALARRLPCLRGRGQGRAAHRRGRHRVRRPLPRRHRRDGRPRAGADGRGRRAQAQRGMTTMLPSEDAVVGRRRVAPPLRPALLAVHALRDRRQPLRDPPLPARSPAAPRSSSIDHCYHGSVDETFATVDATASSVPATATSGRASTPRSRRAWCSGTTWRRWSASWRTVMWPACWRSRR